MKLGIKFSYKKMSRGCSVKVKMIEMIAKEAKLKMKKL